MSVDQFEEVKERAKNENTAMNQQAKVSGKLKLLLWDQACTRSIASSLEKGTVMKVYVLFGWLASSYTIRRAFLQHIS